MQPLILLTIVVGIGSASLVSFVMHCRWRCSVAAVWSGFHELRAAFEIRKRDQPAACWEAAQAGRSEAIEQLLRDFRVERRQYLRQHRGLFRNRESLVVAERPCFRNIPLGRWNEYEVNGL